MGGGGLGRWVGGVAVVPVFVLLVVGGGFAQDSSVVFFSLFRAPPGTNFLLIRPIVQHCHKPPA